MKIQHYMLILATLILGWYCYKKHKDGEFEWPFQKGTDKEDKTAQPRSIEQLEALPQHSLISYEEAQKLTPKYVYFDNPLAPEASYSITTRQDYGDMDIYEHIYTITKETADKLVKDGLRLVSWDFSYNGERYAEIEYDEAIELAKKYPSDLSLSYDSGDGPEYTYHMSTPDKGGRISRRTFAKLMPIATYISVN